MTLKENKDDLRKLAKELESVHHAWMNGSTETGLALMEFVDLLFPSNEEATGISSSTENRLLALIDTDRKRQGEEKKRLADKINLKIGANRTLIDRDKRAGIALGKPRSINNFDRWCRIETLEWVLAELETSSPKTEEESSVG